MSQVGQRGDLKGSGFAILTALRPKPKASFPDMTGFSPRNLKCMCKFAESWPQPAIVQEVLAQITQSLPDELKSSLPTVEEIEAELEGGLG